MMSGNRPIRVVVLVSRKTPYNWCLAKRHQPRRIIQPRVIGIAHRIPTAAAVTRMLVISAITLVNRYSSPMRATMSVISVRQRHANVIRPGRR